MTGEPNNFTIDQDSDVVQIQMTSEEAANLSQAEAKIIKNLQKTVIIIIWEMASPFLGLMMV